MLFKTRLFKLWMVVSVLICLFSCEEKTTIELPIEYKIAVTSELAADKSVILHIVKVSNITQGSKTEQIEAAFVAIKDKQTEQTFIFKPIGNGYWQNDHFLPQQTASYQLTINYKEQHIEAECIVPSFLAITAHRQNTDKVDLSVNIPASESPIILTLQGRKFIMQNNQKIYIGDWEDEAIESNNMATDNFRYGEILTPYLKLFIPGGAARTIKFSPQNNNLNKHFKILAKIVDPNYYTYSYNYECTKNSSLSDIKQVIPLGSNIKNGLGIFGGAYPLIIEL